MTNGKRLNKRILTDRAAHIIISVLALSTVISVILILFFLAKEALLVFSGEDGLSLSQLFGTPLIYQPISNEPKYNLWPLISGTVKVAIIGVLIAFPLAFAAAVFSAEYAGKWLREFIKPMVEMLASLPSVIVGFFALVFIASYFQNVFGLTYRLNALTAGAGVAILMLPTAFTLIEEALCLVPRAMREAGYALGGSKAKILTRLVVKVALPGIVAAFIISFGRAMGETMVVLMAAGNAAQISFSFIEPVRTLASNVGAEMAEVVYGSAHYHVLFFCGFVLLLITMVLNYLSHLLVAKLSARTGG